MRPKRNCTNLASYPSTNHSPMAFFLPCRHDSFSSFPFACPDQEDYPPTLPLAAGYPPLDTRPPHRAFQPFPSFFCDDRDRSDLPTRIFSRGEKRFFFLPYCSFADDPLFFDHIPPSFRWFLEDFQNQATTRSMSPMMKRRTYFSPPSLKSPQIQHRISVPPHNARNQAC